MDDPNVNRLIAEALNKADLLKAMNENLQEQIDALSEALHMTIASLETVKEIMAEFKFRLDIVELGIEHLGRR